MATSVRLGWVKVAATWAGEGQGGGGGVSSGTRGAAATKQETERLSFLGLYSCRAEVLRYCVNRWCGSSAWFPVQYPPLIAKLGVNQIVSWHYRLQRPRPSRSHGTRPVTMDYLYMLPARIPAINMTLSSEVAMPRLASLQLAMLVSRHTTTGSDSATRVRPPVFRTRS